MPTYIMTLRALHLIKEYVRPITRPYWRTFERVIKTEIFITDASELFNLCNKFSDYENNLLAKKIKLIIWTIKY